MDRRTFMKQAAAAAGVAMAGCKTIGDHHAEGTIMTVLGAIAPHEFGPALPHEHIMVDFIGADQVSPMRYDPDNVYRAALPHLVALRRAGAMGFVDCTPAYLARDAQVLERLSRSAQLHILTNTGYYGAANDKYIPAHAYEDSVDALADRWLSEWRNGISGTRIRPGFIKIAVDEAPLSQIDAKLVRAAARVHKASGLTIASHTTSGAAAMEEIALLEAEGVAPQAFIWVHANVESNKEIHVAAAKEGAWVEFDGIQKSTIDLHVDLVRNLRAAGFLDHVLLSHDAGWYTVGEPGGGDFRGYTALFKDFLPALEASDFTATEQDLLIRANPSRAFTIARRLA